MILKLDYKSDTTTLSKNVQVKITKPEDLEHIIVIETNDDNKDLDILLFQTITLGMTTEHLQNFIYKIQNPNFKVEDSLANYIKTEILFQNKYEVRLLPYDFSDYSFFISTEDKNFNYEYIDLFYSKALESCVITFQSSKQFNDDYLNLSLTIENKIELDSTIQHLSEYT